MKISRCDKIASALLERFLFAQHKVPAAGAITGPHVPLRSNPAWTVSTERASQGKMSEQPPEGHTCACPFLNFYLKHGLCSIPFLGPVKAPRAQDESRLLPAGRWHSSRETGNHDESHVTLA